MAKLNSKEAYNKRKEEEEKEKKENSDRGADHSGSADRRRLCGLQAGDDQFFPADRGNQRAG